MKKILVVLIATLFATSVFAQANSKKLIAGVYDFATVESSDWTIIEPTFKSVDPNTLKRTLLPVKMFMADTGKYCYVDGSLSRRIFKKKFFQVCFYFLPNISHSGKKRIQTQPI